MPSAARLAITASKKCPQPPTHTLMPTIPPPADLPLSWGARYPETASWLGSCGNVYQTAVPQSGPA